MITKEMLRTWKAANESISIHITDGQATINLQSTVTVKGFEKSSVRATFNSFTATLPTGYNKAYSYQPIFSGDNGVYGNFGALRLLVREGDELHFRVSDNKNGYMEAAVIPAENLKSFVNGENRSYHPTYYGLHNDTMYVDIIRKGKTIIRNMYLQSSTCPDNSARMLSYK